MFEEKARHNLSELIATAIVNHKVVQLYLLLNPEISHSLSILLYKEELDFILEQIPVLHNVFKINVNNKALIF